MSSDCTWIEDDRRSLNLESAADRRHLRFDAITAEDVSIRWADRYYTHQSQYDRRQYECMNAIFSGVAAQHGVTVETVWQYRAQRDIPTDAVVIVSFGLIYTAAAYYLAGRIRRRFPAGEPGFWIMAVTMSFCIALVGLAAGNVWSIIIEEFRIGSGHLSYRMNYIPLRQHWAITFVCGFIIFLIAAVIRFRGDMRQKRDMKTSAA